MNTKNEIVQDTLDLQVEEPVTIKKEPKISTAKKPVRAVKNTAGKDPSEKGETAKKKATPKKPASKASSAKKEKAVKAADSDKMLKTTSAKQDKEANKEAKPKVAAKKAPVKKVVTKKDEKKTAPVKQKNEKASDTVNVAANEYANTVEIKDNENSADTVNEPIVEDIKRHKLFFVSDMDEEAVYLHEMSLQGYHFLTKKGMQYIFRQGEPKNYYYHLGYYEKDKRDGERYLDNYSDAGWENIFHEKAEFDGVWNYFRIEMPIGESEPNIFSDRVSRLALYKRLLSSWRTLLAVDIICFFFTLFVYIFLTNHPMNMTNVYRTLCAVLDLIIVLIFIIYFRAYLKISRKQRELENI